MTFFSKFALVLTLIFTTSCHSHKKDSSIFYLGGIAINEASMDDWVNTFRRVGMNTVEVTVYAKQWEWYWDRLQEDEEADGIVEEIRAAKKAGLSVVMVLRVQLQHWFPSNQFKWHGMIMPVTEGALISWFEKYENYCLKWAKIGEEEGVDILVIGSELNALTSTVPIKKLPPLYQYYNNIEAQSDYEKRILKYEDVIINKNVFRYNNKNGSKQKLEDYLNNKISEQHHWSQMITFANCDNSLGMVNERRSLVKKKWIELIQNTRNVFSGKLSYAANFDNYQEVDFWEYLDFVGINAYFPLRKASKDPLVKKAVKKEFEKSWATVFEEINDFQEKKQITNKPILFTELGYTNYLDCTLESWKGSGFSLVGKGKNEKLIIWKDQPKFPQERIWAAEALYKIAQKTEVDLQGILYWKLTTHEYLLKEEPFGLHFHQTSIDGLQNVLVRFLETRKGK